MSGSLEFSTNSQGDYTSNGIGIGPQIGYAFGGPQSKVFPYLDLGLRYYTMNADYGYGSRDNFDFSGSDTWFGFGVIVPLKTHIGLTFGAGYHIFDLKDIGTNDNHSGNIFAVGIGIAGLLFNDAI